ncbi:unnamed protein product [Prorocentrum cordatum]|uniref:Very-long-chain 3-oxoacyl-CoA synthase n=1 Tax=Prorocentrum cordatum TaxID=2364126 RepID=A0ABN9QH42_9DINO|nr:unnamed protein product [Polarella glacialis]
MVLLHLPALQYKANMAITSLQVLGLGGGLQEVQGTNAGYSKFADATAAFKVPSRLGMTLLYSPALLVSLAYLKNDPKSGNGREKLTALLLSVHFGKRVLESLFLHRYSGTMNGDFLAPVSTSYALTATLIAHLQRQIANYAGSVADQRMLLAGIVLNAVGQLGNLYHHWLLAAMRPTKGGAEESSKYVVPSGGMFRHGGGCYCPALLFRVAQLARYRCRHPTPQLVPGRCRHALLSGRAFLCDDTVVQCKVQELPRRAQAPDSVPLLKQLAVVPLSTGCHSSFVGFSTYFSGCVHLQISSILVVHLQVGCCVGPFEPSAR